MKTRTIQGVLDRTTAYIDAAEARAIGRVDIYTLSQVCKIRDGLSNCRNALAYRRWGSPGKW